VSLVQGLGAAAGALVLGVWLAIPLTAWSGEPTRPAEIAPASSATTGQQAKPILGPIVVDRQARRFRVPGTLIRLAAPLEYLAVGRNGLKAYESLLQLDASGTEFNTACILVGLEPPKGATPHFQFDTHSIDGQPVGLRVAWEGQSGHQEMPAERLLAINGQEVSHSDWVYLGSFFGGDKRYAAEVTGTLIGFVHDPMSVIENRHGLAIGHYGSVGGNMGVAPPVGTKVWLTVTNLGAASGASKTPGQ
jgi:hypothetical protein